MRGLSSQKPYDTTVALNGSHSPEVMMINDVIMRFNFFVTEFLFLFL